MKVTVLVGRQGNIEIQNETFDLVKPGIHPSKKGPFVLVDGTSNDKFAPRNFRIFITSPNDVKFDGIITNHPMHMHEPIVTDLEPIETDREVKARIHERFEILREMAQSASTGRVRGLVVSGAPGTGKSYEVEETLTRETNKAVARANMGTDDVEADDYISPDKRWTFVKGYMSAPGLYQLLYDYRKPGQTIVMDDCDAVWYDENSLNLMKAALDTSKKRVLSWVVSEGRADAPPKTFEYQGALIAITNLNFERVVQEGRSKLVPHLSAIMDRCFYLDMTINTLREKLLRIEQVSLDLGLLETSGINSKEAKEIMKFIRDRATDFRHLSLRKVVQLADLYRMDNNWQRKAEITLLRAQ